MEGILNVDKPLNLTSHDAVSRVRRLADTRRVGHAGTLDPLATGVLVLALGRATRLLEYVVDQPKRYRALIRLGQVSTTYDGEGEISDTGPVVVRRNEIVDALAQFQGAIKQVPPMHSALKKEGVPLYELARQGIEVERAAREVTVYELALVEWDSPLVEVDIVCSAGTYIRSLAHDIGQALGSGAYLAGLRRTAVGLFHGNSAVPLASLSEANVIDFLQPMDSAVAHLPVLPCSFEEAVRLAHGQRIARDVEGQGVDLARAYDPDGTFVGVVTAEGQRWRPRKIFYDLGSQG